MSFWSRVRDTAKAVAKAVRNPSSYAPPPLPTQPPVTPRADRGVERPPTTRTTRYIPRRELPASWGGNKAALWSDAARASGTEAMGRDENAQRFYDAALYTFADTHEQRANNLNNFKQYIHDTYGVDWDAVFDWEEYRRNYDGTGANV
jgi:hypothetical protein